MVQEALGHDSYQRAIKSYLEEYAYRDATEEDLLREFQKVIDAEKITIDGKDSFIICSQTDKKTDRVGL